MKHDHGIKDQALAASQLVNSLSDVLGDDEFIHDTVEGETDLFEATQRCLDEIAECEMISAGVSDMIAKLQKRKSSAENRAERIRGLIDQCFQVAGVKTHKFASATISTKRVPPKLIISDEAEIPSEYFISQPPKLDRKKLSEAVKIGPVDGATISNGGTTIQIRRH